MAIASPHPSSHLEAGHAGASAVGATDAVLITLWMIGIYTNLPLNLTSTIFVPGFLSVLASGLMIIRRPDILSDFVWRPVSYLFLLFLVSVVTAPHGSVTFGHRALSLAGITEGLSTSIVSYLFVRRFTSDQLARVCLAWLFFIAIGTMLENADILRDASDSFRNWAYTGHFLYTSEGRDLNVYGAIRPKLFTQEPSNVAKMFLYASWAYLVLKNKLADIALLSALTIAGYLFIRSPFVVAIIPVSFLTHFLTNRYALASRKQKWKYIVWTAILATLGLVLTYYLVLSLFEERVLKIISGSDLSFLQRVIFPLYMSYKSLALYPITGVGLGGIELLAPFIHELMPIKLPLSYFIEILPTLVSNSFFSVVITFGVAGTAIFFILMRRLYQDICPKTLIFALLATVVVFNGDSAIIGVRVWGYLFLLLAAAHIHIRELDANSVQLSADSAISIPDPARNPTTE